MSHELLVYLSPDQFLGMAYTLPESPHSIDNIVELASLMRGGTQMDDVPYLLINEFGRVTGHEGRHRANALRRMGYQKMPVRLMSNNFADIRWGQQSDPNNSNYKQRLPDVLISEEGYQAMEVPYETEGPRRGMPRPEYADSTPQKTPRPSFEWEGQFVRGWDYEARMLPELGSEEFHNAAHRTKIKVEARAMFDRVGAELSGFDKRMHDIRGVEAYEDQLYSLYREPQFKNIEVGFIEQARKADGQPFDIFWEDDRFDLGDLAEQEIYWNPTESKAEVAQAKEQILRDRAETRRHQEAYIEELEAKRLAEELEEQRMLATLTPQERAAYLKKKQDELFDDLILLQEQPQEPRMADDMVDVYGRKLTEEQALKELADLQEQFRVTAPDSRAYNELRGEIRLLDRALENYYTQVPATTDIFGDPVETRRPDPSDFLEDPVVTRTMETGLPEDFGPPRTMRDPTPTVRGDTKTFIDAFDQFAGADDKLLMTMRQDPSLEELFELHDEQAARVREFREELELERSAGRFGFVNIAEDREYDLEMAQKELENTRQRLRDEYLRARSKRARARAELEERYASTVREPFIEEEVFDREKETRRRMGQLRRVEAAERAARFPAQPGLSAMLESEGIPRDSFLDFIETPENRRSGKSIPQLIEDYKIAGELFGSAEETGLRVFTPTDVEADFVTDEDMLMRGLFADDDLMEAGARAYDMTPGEYRERVRQQADFYDELLQEGRTPAIDFDDPLQRSAYEIAEQRQMARRVQPQTLMLAPGSPSRRMTLERRPDSPSGMQLLRQAAEEGESLPTASDVLPTGPESRRTQGVGAQLSEGQTEAGQGALRGAAELEPDKVRMAVDRPLLSSTTGALGFDPATAPGPGSGSLSSRFTATAEQARDLLADPDIEAKIDPKQLSRIRELALKAAPILRAAGNAALAGELVYYSVKERSVPGGVMAAGAAAVEGTGALMGLPQAAYETFAPNYQERAEQGMLSRPEVLAEGAAALGRGIASTVGAYGREKERKARRKQYEEATEFGVRMGLDQETARRRAKKYMEGWIAAREQGLEPPPINSDPYLQPSQDEALMNGMR